MSVLHLLTLPRLTPHLLAMVAASVLTPVAGEAHARERASVYTSLRNADCRFEPADGPGSEESQTKRCLGVARVRVVVTSGGTSVALGFEWPGANPPADARSVVVGWSLGERLEWRGDGSGSHFDPDSVIVRVLFNRDESPQIGHQVLAVLRVRRGSACLRGVVDMSASRTPYELARRVSDDPSAFVCGETKPSVEGQATEWTSRVVGRSGRVAR